MKKRYIALLILGGLAGLLAYEGSKTPETSQQREARFEATCRSHYSASSDVTACEDQLRLKEFDTVQAISNLGPSWEVRH